MHYLDKKAPKFLTEGTYYQIPLKNEKKKIQIQNKVLIHAFQKLVLRLVRLVKNLER